MNKKDYKCRTLSQHQACYPPDAGREAHSMAFLGSGLAGHPAKDGLTAGPFTFPLGYLHGRHAPSLNGRVP